MPHKSRVLPMLGCWTLRHSLDSLSSFWISVKLNKLVIESVADLESQTSSISLYKVIGQLISKWLPFWSKWRYHFQILVTRTKQMKWQNMDRVTPVFLSFDSFDLNRMSPKFSFAIFTNFQMAGTSNSIAKLNHWVKWRVFTFQACNTFYYKFSFLFQISRNWKETSQNTSQTSRITQTKSRSQTSHKVRNHQKTNQFDGFRKIFGRFTNLELATQRVLPIFGWWRFLHILASLSSFWKSEKSKNNYISLKASE